MRREWRRSGRTISPSPTAAARSCAASASTVASGEVVGLLGPNGAGKTTTFYMTVGLTAPDSGRVTLDGADVTDDPMYVRARKGIGYLPQEPSIFRGLTVEQNMLAILETLDLTAADAAAALAGAARRAEPDCTWPRSPAYTLSGGERRRAEITRALVISPEVHPARRAVRRHRPDRRHRHPEDHLPPEGARDRRAHHRPQRARDAAHHRPRLHRARWRASSGAARPTSWRPTRTCGGFISGPISGWTRIGSGSGARTCAGVHGDSAETSHQARSEADPDAIAAAGDQAAADVDARAVRPAQPGDGREPAARGDARPRTAADRRRRGAREGRGRAAAEAREKTDTWDDSDYEYFFGDYLDDGYRPRAPQEVKELPPIENTLSTEQLALRSPAVAALAADRRRPAPRDRQRHHRQPRRRRVPGGVARRDRGDGAVGRSPTSSGRSALVQGFDPIGVAARDLQECLLLQIRHLGLEGTPTEKIVTEHLRLLQNHQVPEISRKLGHPDRGPEGAHRDHPAPRSRSRAAASTRRSRST